jgi:hypothetical protein
MRLRYVTSVLILTLAAVSLPRGAHCQENTDRVSRAELHELLVKMAELLERPEHRTEATTRLRQQIDTLEPQALEAFYRFGNNWKKLRIAVSLMAEGASRNSGGSAHEARAYRTEGGVREASPAGLPADLFTTAYPTGNNYATFRATLPGLGAMGDTPGSVPGLNDERCDANFEAGVAIASATFAFANIIAEAACEALPELTDIPCWIAQGVLQAAARPPIQLRSARLGRRGRCREIEAGYENTVAIYKNLDAHHLALNSQHES